MPERKPSGPITSYRDLIVWQEAMTLAEGVYRLTSAFPREELYGAVSQIRRTAASVPVNIAEGYGRDSPGAYVQQLRVANGSLKELETHLILSARVGLTSTGSITAMLDTAEAIGKMLRSLIRSIEKRQ